jgi:hypothetical protein
MTDALKPIDHWAQCHGADIRLTAPAIRQNHAL